MMTVQMNSVPSPSSREFAETLHQKNIELEKSLRKSAQSKIPSNPSTWLEMRENFEGIILADHDFAQKHDTETALWQLHYRRIEEFRAHIKSASNSSAQSQGGTKTNTNANVNTERVKRIKSTFKVFLSESTGYYHELMLKIRSKYGLPLGYFSEGPELKINPVKDEKRAKEMKKGLLSCHKCLIYLGDLARYKGLYGEGDSVEREFSAANSYYLQAVSLYPASGNPHHQLGLLANYSHNELLLVYRYFRSLAVEFPFNMARENLVVAFEKNRQQYIQLATNTVTKATNTRMGTTRPTGKFRGKGETKSSLKETKTEQVSNKEPELSIPEVFRSFCVRFVRLNGILFTRTSLETFDEVFSSLMADLQILLSSGPEEQLNFGTDFTENALLVLRLIAMLIFTIHNSKRDSENQSYAEIVQRTLLLKNAFNFSFEFVGYIIKRCIEVKDISSSFYMNGILVYLEWLACHMDIATGSGSGTGTEIDEKQANARCFFWNQFVHLMNKLVCTGLASFEGDNDLSCFFEMSKYDEGETGNRLALWEDFELRGFLPLVPAQVILDFSRKSDGGLKEKKFRVERIFAAGRALTNVVQIGPNKIYFDQGAEKFVICKDPPEFVPPMQIGPETIANGIKQENHVNQNMPVLGNLEEEEDEVIVFQPNIKSRPSSNVNVVPNHNDEKWKIIPSPNNDNFMENIIPNPNDDDFMDRNIQMSGAGWINTISAPINKQHQLQGIIPDNGLDLGNSSAKMPPVNNWVSDQEAFLSTGLNNFTIAENGILEQRKNFSISENGILDQRLQGIGLTANGIPFPSHIAPPPAGFNNNNNNMISDGYMHQIPFSSPAGFNNNNNNMISDGYMHQIPFSSQVPTSVVTSNNINMLTSLAMSAGLNVMPSVLDFGVPTEGFGTKFMEKLPVSSKKNPNPVSRPVRHAGPPPGFNAPMKRLDETQNYPNIHPSHTDEYGYLNAYQLVPNHGTSNNQLGYNNYMNFATGTGTGTGTNTGTGMEMFASGFGYPTSSVPVSGTQASAVKDFQLFESSKPNNSNNNGQQEKLQNSLWSGNYFV